MPIFTDGYGGDVFSADDTSINIWGDGDRNGGGHESFVPRGPLGTVRERGLLRFNLSSIPADAVCDSATLYLYHNSAPEAAPNPALANVHSISLANSDWVAGIGNIDLALEGENCWNCKASDGAGSCNEAWAGSNGCDTAGTDYETPVLGTYSVDPGSAIGTDYGLIVLGNNNSEIHLGQSDETITAYRPKLVIE